MSYNNKLFQTYLDTAGKITVITAFAGVVIFSLVFLLNIGANEYKQAVAQVATTSVTVLNTPPTFDNGPFETPESSTTTPTNSGDTMTWTAVASDSNNEDYFLLICDGETASPTANNGAPPTCGAGDLMWARSATTSSGALATAATTTSEVAPFDTEEHDWYAWVCDAVSNARCSNTYSQGTGSTSSPFNVNHRPGFTGFWDDSPADPGTTVTFYATSTDGDSTGAQDVLTLYVCDTDSFNSTSSLGCNGTEYGSTTFPVHPNATATYALPSVIQDDDYFAYGFIVDNHGHEASGGSQGTDSNMTVSNVAPTVAAGSISLNGGVDIALTEGIENTGFTLDYVVTDNNSCDAVGGGNADEWSTSTISVYRSSVTRANCAATSTTDYDPNNCYTSANNSSTWNLQCTASSTTCTAGGSDPTMTVECTLPLWFIADATDVDSVYETDDWRAAIEAIDDDSAASVFTESSGPNPDVTSVTALNLLDATIPYGGIEPGNDTGTLNASTTVESTGNTGLDENLSGEAMCITYQTGNECPNSATSTIPDFEQEFGTSSVSYGLGTDLSSTTVQQLEINIPKTTSTSTFNASTTWWGIAVPATITLSGSYTGENNIQAVKSASSTW